ncbi:COG4705 family protein [Bacillus sp. OTU530]|uniref:COG4705 family protein n=1 Tax=Bacillus sp. OTU530 TaxID=3043862 RepID=UPI00313D3E8B
MDSKGKTQDLISKVPEITLLFWIIKILTTGMGEVFADYLNESLAIPLAVSLSVLGLLVSLGLQFSMHKYIPSVYWLVVVMVSIFGTTAADIVSFSLGHSPLVATFIYLALLLAVLVTWYAKEKTLSVHSIYTRRRETFYWLTVLATFALGTAAGDMSAGTLHLGFFTSGIFYTVLLVIPMILSRLFPVNQIFAFWFSYVMTRPAGASFADWMASPTHRGGLGMDKGFVSLVLTIMILVLVGYVSFAHKNSTALKSEVTPS